MVDADRPKATEGQTKSPVTPPNRVSAEACRVLVAVDDPAEQASLARAVASLGHAVIVARDAEHAAELLEKPLAPDVALIGSHHEHVAGAADGAAPAARITRAHGVAARARRYHDERVPHLVLAAPAEAYDAAAPHERAMFDDWLELPATSAAIDARLRSARQALASRDRMLTMARALEPLEMKDAATGLWTRARALDALDREVARAKRTYADVTVMFVAIDGFRSITERFGASCASRVLADVASALTRVVRVYDALARWDDDEILVIAPGCDDINAIKFGERMRLTVAALAGAAEGGGPRVTCSVGGATSASGELDPTELVASARSALAAATARGGNRVELCHVRTLLPESSTQLAERPSIRPETPDAPGAMAVRRGGAV
jgi:diguanylate cyclase (GGDEF)-like protein